MKVNKKKVLTNKQEWKIDNLFYEKGSKWWVKAHNINTNQEVEFYVTTSYLHRVTGKNGKNTYTLAM